LIVRAFMIRLSDDSFVAAMTTIIIFLPTSESLIMFYFPGNLVAASLRDASVRLCDRVKGALRTAKRLQDRFRKRQKLHHANEVERLTGYAATRVLVRANTNLMTSRIVDSTIMKRALLCLVVTFCAVSLAHGEPTTRSLQQTLKDQGFYYGAVTGEKNTETTAAIRRYQIRNGLQVTGELNDETLRSVKSNRRAPDTTAIGCFDLNPHEIVKTCATDDISV